MSDELDQLLRSLHLRPIAEILDEVLALAEQQGPSYREFLLRLLRPQWHARQDQALAWRIRRAKLPEPWSLETFPFDLQTGIDRRLIRSLAELDFIPRAVDVGGGVRRAVRRVLVTALAPWVYCPRAVRPRLRDCSTRTLRTPSMHRAGQALSADGSAATQRLNSSSQAPSHTDSEGGERPPPPRSA